MLITYLTFVLVLLGLLTGGNLVSAQQYNTFYSPEKRFAIDYPIFDS